MFGDSTVEELPAAGILVDEDSFDPAWLDEAAWLTEASGPPEAVQPPVSACAPSGWLALELDQGCADQTSPTNPPNAPSQGAHGCSFTSAGGPGKPLVFVIVPITMLLGLNEQPGELVGDGPIPAELAREIAAQGTWRRLPTDPVSGTLLDYKPAARADLDHTIPYHLDGPTSEHNLHASCRHHHRLKTHAPGWHVDHHPDSTITWTTPTGHTWTTPTGHTYTSNPNDYRPDSHPPPGDDPPPF